MRAKFIAANAEIHNAPPTSAIVQSISVQIVCSLPPVNDERSTDDAPSFRQQKLIQVGWVLMIGSTGFWALVLVVPFVPLSNGERATAVAALLILAEITFWVGALMAGPDAARRMKTWWRASRDGSPEQIVEPNLHDDCSRNDVQTNRNVQVRTKPS